MRDDQKKKKSLVKRSLKMSTVLHRSKEREEKKMELCHAGMYFHRAPGLLSLCPSADGGGHHIKAG